MFILRYIKLNIPIALWIIWVHCLGYYCLYYAGSMYYPSTSIVPFFTIILVSIVLFWTCGIAILFYFGQLFILLYKKNYHKCIQNIIAIIFFITFVFYIKPCPGYIPFALGLKNYFEKQINFDQFRQWIESDQIEGKMVEGILFIDKYDDPDVPVMLQNDVKKLSPMRIDIGILPSGSKYLRLRHYGGLIGDFGFVTGANKDVLPYDKYAGTEYRTEIDNKSFVWIRPRQD